MSHNEPIPSSEEIKEWIDNILASYETLSSWQKMFIGDIARQYRVWKESEAPGYPLSYMQTVMLRTQHARLAAKVVEAVKLGGKE